jgi:hypothetical protein
MTIQWSWEVLGNYFQYCNGISKMSNFHQIIPDNSLFGLAFLKCLKNIIHKITILRYSLSCNWESWISNKASPRSEMDFSLQMSTIAVRSRNSILRTGFFTASLTSGRAVFNLYFLKAKLYASRPHIFFYS